MCFVKIAGIRYSKGILSVPLEARQCGSIPILKPAHREEVDFGAYYQIAYDDEDD